MLNANFHAFVEGVFVVLISKHRMIGVVLVGPSFVGNMMIGGWDESNNIDIGVQ